MGQLFKSQCLPDGNAAAAAWCSDGWPKLEGTTLRTCDVLSADAVQIFSPGACSGSWVVVSSSGYTAPFEWGGDGIGGFVGWIEGYGVSALNIVPATDGNSFTGSDSAGYTYTVTRTCSTEAQSQVLSLAFPQCDELEAYADMTSLFGIAAIGLVTMWAMRSFILKLLQNQ